MCCLFLALQVIPDFAGCSLFWCPFLILWLIPDLLSIPDIVGHCLFCCSFLILLVDSHARFCWLFFILLVIPNFAVHSSLCWSFLNVCLFLTLLVSHNFASHSLFCCSFLIVLVIPKCIGPSWHWWSVLILLFIPNLAGQIHSPTLSCFQIYYRQNYLCSWLLKWNLKFVLP